LVLELDLVIQLIWIYNALVLYLFCILDLYFFLINILDLYLDLLILYQKAKDSKIIKVSFGKIKIRPKTQIKKWFQNRQL
jgi:uncharacterized membrane protein